MAKPFYEVRQLRDLRDLITQSVELFGERPAFEVKDFKNKQHYNISYNEYYENINALGTALIDMGLKNEKIAISGDNCYEWCLTYMATVLGVGVIVPIDK